MFMCRLRLLCLDRLVLYLFRQNKRPQCQNPSHMPCSHGLTVPNLDALLSTALPQRPGLNAFSRLTRLLRGCFSVRIQAECCA